MPAHYQNAEYVPIVNSESPYQIGTERGTSVTYHGDVGIEKVEEYEGNQPESPDSSSSRHEWVAQGHSM